MVLPTPKLDDRTFQDLVNETKRLIPRYCPEWTDHNVSDPGIALLELFAYMVDILLYRVNRVPELCRYRWLSDNGGNPIIDQVHGQPAETNGSAISEKNLLLSELGKSAWGGLATQFELAHHPAA